MPDERVEGEGDHGCDGDALGAGPRVEDFGGDNPGKGATGCGEGEVVEPGPGGVLDCVEGIRGGGGLGT